MADEDDLGPAMSALTERQRGFVMAMVQYPGITQSKAAKMAGYSDKSEAAKVTGHHLAHNPLVQAAIRECAGLRLNFNTLMAADVLIAIAGNSEVDPKDRIKAAGMLLDRTGFAAVQTINVNKTVTDRSGKAVMARLQELAAKHGIDPMKLLGPAEADPVVEGEFSEVEASK